MSVRPGRGPTHRNQAAGLLIPTAFTGRPMTRVEARANEGARKAVNPGWTKLREAPAWDEPKVKEWTDAAHDARKEGGGRRSHGQHVSTFVLRRTITYSSGDSAENVELRSAMVQAPSVLDQEVVSTCLSKLLTA